MLVGNYACGLTEKRGGTRDWRPPPLVGLEGRGVECAGGGAPQPAGPGWPRLSPTLLLSLSPCGLFFSDEHAESGNTVFYRKKREQ